LPLNAEWIVLVIAYRYLQMRKWNLAIETYGRRYPDVIVLHHQGLLLRCFVRTTMSPVAHQMLNRVCWTDERAWTGDSTSIQRRLRS
jgi:hypothetical protein